MIDQFLAFVAWRVEAWTLRMMDLRLSVLTRDWWNA
jgi:hypothetical protein